LELLLGSRRGRLRTLCRLYASWLVLQFLILFLSYLPEIPFGNQPPLAAVSRFVNAYLDLFVGQHFLLLILVTPTFVAGAIADDKAQGTFQDLLLADLTSWDIAIGKFLGRTSQVAVLALVGAPFFGFVGGYGHVNLLTLLALPAVTAILVFALGAAGLLASVWSRQTRDAVLRVYFWLGLGGGACWGLLELIDHYLWTFPPASRPYEMLTLAGGVLHSLNPLYVLEPAWDRNDLGELAWRLLAGATVWGSLGIGCLLLAVWRLRPAYRRQWEGAARPGKFYRRRRRSAPDDDPVRWKEREFKGPGLFSWLPPLPRWLGMAGIAASTLWLTHFLLQKGEPEEVLPAQTLAVFFLASLFVGVRASGTVSGERERQTWELLLLTPVETWELVGDKLRGILDSVHLYLLAYAVPCLLLGARRGNWGWVLTAGLLLATWAGVYYMAATGILCSARSRSSWRSLLATLASGYGFGLGLVCLFSLAYLWVMCLGQVVLAILALFGVQDQGMVLTGSLSVVGMIGLAWWLWWMARAKVAAAEDWVDQERDRRTFTRVLARALRKHAERLEERCGQQDEVEKAASP
jgi:ABC-type transport system involved in multi-copper enzyme maturation permease subunit